MFLLALPPTPPAKQEDDELVLQIVYLFYQLVLHESTRHCIVESSRILIWMIC